MSNRRIRFFISAALVLLLITGSISPAFSAYRPLPQVYRLVSGETDAEGNVYPDYLVDEQGNRVEETGGVVRAAAALPSSYDVRNYGWVTSVKNQAGAGSCWAFATIGSLESNYIRKGYGTAADTDFSEAHLVWFSQRQRTTNMYDPTYGDGKMTAQPFTTGGNWNSAASALIRGSGLQLEQNAPWVETYDEDTMMTMEQPESERYVSYARMWGVTSVRDNSSDALKQLILKNGAAMFSYYDDYSTTRTGYNASKTAYYQTAKVGVTNHGVTVVGWDDNYSRTNFNTSPRPSSNGAWLVKGSWAKSWGDNGYYWISYEDPSIGTMVSYEAAPADTYARIYQYDGSFPKMFFTMPDTAQMANLFTAVEDEWLTHAAFFSPTAQPVTAKVEVYTADDDYTFSGKNPTKGMSKISDATVTASDVGYGYHTVELATPVRLHPWQAFTVVVTFTNTGSTVLIPIEGKTVNNPGDGVVTCAGNEGESFVNLYNNWYDTNAYPDGSDYNNVCVKAMSTPIEPGEATLEIRSLPTKTTYRYGETLDVSGLSLLYTDEYGDTEIVTDGYDYDEITFRTFGKQTITVEYGSLTASFDVTVEPYEKTLTVKSLPRQTVYYPGDTISTSGLQLVYRDEYGIETTLTSGFSLSPTVVREPGMQPITVTYNGVQTAFDVIVEPYTCTLTVNSLPSKTTYYPNEQFDPAGLSLLYTDEYGEPSVVTQDYSYTEPDLHTLGDVSVWAEYAGLNVSFNVHVEPLEPELRVQKLPDTLSYRIGETVDLSGLELFYTDEYGDALIITQDFDCDVPELTAAGTYTITVCYGDLTVQVPITVEEPGQFLLTGGSARPGETVRVSLRIAKNPGIVAMRIRLWYDSGVLSLEGVENGDIFPENAMTTGGTLSDMPYTMHWMDALARENYTQTGCLVTFVFRVLPTAQTGETQVRVDYDAGSTYDVDLRGVPMETGAGSVTVERLAGDADADGTISLKDVAVMSRFLASWNVLINADNADVNGSGSVDLKDVALLSRYIAGGYGVILQ